MRVKSACSISLFNLDMIIQSQIFPFRHIQGGLDWWIGFWRIFDQNTSRKKSRPIPEPKFWRVFWFSRNLSTD